jgi:hypothetical protein
VKKLLTILLAAVVACAAFAQNSEASLKLSGDVKTGIYYNDIQQDGKELEVDELKVENHDNDPNGNRFRLNLDYDNGNNVGFRARLQWTTWNNETYARWAYAFGYGNFFNDTPAQMTVSVGKLGGSPWGTGGPEMWKELEDNNSGGGMRVEWKPAIPAEWGKINAGFVLNYYNQDRDQGVDNSQVKITLGEILKESVIGVSYTHEWFMARMAYRFDSEVDANQANKAPGATGQGEDELVYRVEEYAIQRWAPGFRIWGLGHLYGLSAKNKGIQVFRNWFFIGYDPPELWGIVTPFSALVSLGNESSYIEDPADASKGAVMGEFFLKPSFYWHFSPGGYNKLISIGSAYKISFDYGEGGIQGPHPYYYMEIEPKVQLNFQSSYIAFAYQFRKEYIHDYNALAGREPIVQKQWMNLRFCINF